MISNCPNYRLFYVELNDKKSIIEKCLFSFRRQLFFLSSYPSNYYYPLLCRCSGCSLRSDYIVFFGGFHKKPDAIRNKPINRILRHIFIGGKFIYRSNKNGIQSFSTTRRRLSFSAMLAINSTLIKSSNIYIRERDYHYLNM